MDSTVLERPRKGIQLSFREMNSKPSSCVSTGAEVSLGLSNPAHCREAKIISFSGAQLCSTSQGSRILVHFCHAKTLSAALHYFCVHLLRKENALLTAADFALS